MFPATVIKVNKYMIGTLSTKSKLIPCNQFMWYEHFFNQHIFMEIIVKTELLYKQRMRLEIRLFLQNL